MYPVKAVIMMIIIIDLPVIQVMYFFCSMKNCLRIRWEYIIIKVSDAVFLCIMCMFHPKLLLSWVDMIL
jgi:hypothetical protein